MNRLDGRVAIVTGATPAIGKACVIRMAEEGAEVAALDADAKGEDDRLDHPDHDAEPRPRGC